MRHGCFVPHEFHCNVNTVYTGKEQEGKVRLFNVFHVCYLYVHCGKSGALKQVQMQKY